MFDLQDLFQWDRFITPTIIKTFYWLAIGLIVLFGIYGILSGLTYMAISPFVGFILLLSSIASVVVGIVFSRIAAEFILIVFRINEHLGASFFEYVNQLRIEEAKRLLTETTRSDLHVIEAAYMVGFNNKVSFNTAFKKATGMTPTEYRRNHAKSDGCEEKPGAVGQ